MPFEALVADVCGIVVEYVGYGHEAFALSLVSSTWNDHVRFSEPMMQQFSFKFPIHFAALPSPQDGDGKVLEGHDWRALLVKRLRGSQLIPSPDSIATRRAASRFLRHTVNYAASWFVTRKIRLVLAGLDNAGKTTFLRHKMLTETFESPICFRSFEEVTAHGRSFSCYDLAGHSAARRLWKIYVTTGAHIMFVVDAANPERFAEVRTALHDLCGAAEPSSLVIVLANKQDLAGAVSTEQLIVELEVQRLKQKWCVRGTTAVSKENEWDCLRWQCDNL